MKLLLFLCVLILPNFCFLLETSEKVDFISRGISYPKDRKLPDGRIIGGQEVIPHTYPFQVGLYINSINGNRYFCGGTLITTEWVLTAAHCLDLNVQSIQVYLGSHYVTAAFEDTRTVLNASMLVIHPGWTGNFLRNDIGLVRLSVNVTLSEHISLVKFARGNNTYAGQRATMVGWGLTESTSSISSVLRHVSSTVLTNEACDNFSSYNGIILPSHICSSGDGPVGTCSGDSGGPLLVDGVQVGITSFGTTDCTIQFPSVFTRVSEFNEWLSLFVPDGSDSINSLHYSLVISVVLCLYQLFIYT